MLTKHPMCSIFEMFLGFLVGVVLLLLTVWGTTPAIPGFFSLLGLETIGATFTIIIAILGFLVSLLFGLCIFKRVWRCCFGK
ncbi:ABC transporter [Domibacillus sp. DTU_2020_1001157_1_SI_ALB_TIR_016]|uniref:ABC transporter n=1 Tax=Domibacillus sp. DTU_2020_1001157_1_SI_ALB_TIR_016 TaxID=3077789 RepID=UPI0028EA6F39|nr:ABC transporter [Domibacillus sp. DTU_2020_1001157_1_SI_ALB_TIR_016]WNS79412.1 ABC transporter [Domibacillus sp. DTU_2020_1001157_1_SI_ALB_TIR_016]